MSVAEVVLLAFALVDGEKLSTPITERTSSSKGSQRCDPMNPAAPVTTTATARLRVAAVERRPQLVVKGAPGRNSETDSAPRGGTRPESSVSLVIRG